MPDPGLVGDTCLFLNHGPAPNWWLSPDVVVNGFDGVPVPAGARTVTVTTRNQSGAQCGALQGSGTRVELWVANPSLVMDKTNPTTCKRIGLLPDIIPVGGGSKPVTFNWTVPAAGTGPDSPGHKCLIGLLYPTGFTPDFVSFFPSDDAHYAQKNLCIVTCTSPCGLDVQTANTNREEAQEVIIQAVADLEPTETLLKVVMPALQAFKGFKRLSRERPPRVKIQLKRHRQVEYTDSWEQYERPSAPNTQAKIVMKPGQRVRFRVEYGSGEGAVGGCFPCPRDPQRASKGARRPDYRICQSTDRRNQAGVLRDLAFPTLWRRCLTTSDDGGFAGALRAHSKLPSVFIVSRKRSLHRTFLGNNLARVA